MKNDLEKLSDLNDTDFLRYAKHFRLHFVEYKLLDNVTKYINNRCNQLGYSFELGCCGSNKLKRINK